MPYFETKRQEYNDSDTDYWPIIWADGTTVASFPAGFVDAKNGNIPTKSLAKLSLYVLTLDSQNIRNNNPDDVRLMGFPAAIGSLELMIRFAEQDGVIFKVSTGYRSYAEQKSLWDKRYTSKRPNQKQWNRKRQGGYANRSLDATAKDWKGKRYWLKDPNEAALARPGTSNHGLGLAFDLATDNQDGNARSLGANTAETDWLRRNAWAFGFYWEVQRGRDGFEAWHLVWVRGDDTGNIPVKTGLAFGPANPNKNYKYCPVPKKQVKNKKAKLQMTSIQRMIQMEENPQVVLSLNGTPKLPSRWWTEKPMTWFDDWTNALGGSDIIAETTPIQIPMPI
jgi:LAS superfamily LD-carboxypeptidase LdcB